MNAAIVYGVVLARRRSRSEVCSREGKQTAANERLAVISE